MRPTALFFGRGLGGLRAAGMLTTGVDGENNAPKSIKSAGLGQDFRPSAPDALPAGPFYWRLMRLLLDGQSRFALGPIECQKGPIRWGAPTHASDLWRPAPHCVSGPDSGVHPNKVSLLFNAPLTFPCAFRRSPPPLLLFDRSVRRGASACSFLHKAEIELD